MTSDPAQLRQWFEAACDLPEAEWASFLEGCDEPSLRAEVLDLLRRDRVPGLPLDDPLLPVARDALLALACDAPLPARIGGYEVVRVIGRGSMGTVYEARATDGGPHVAIKVLRMGLPTRALLHRFRREAEILARLDHPCIARILESGTTELGLSTLPFIAMELVSGRPLDVYCDEEGLDVRARLALLARVGEGIEHAHRCGVVHRDLKPSNILVDAQGRPRLLDFGVARTSWTAAGSASQHTATGQLVGTLQYMSPEQTRGDPSAVDARSDVYALGAVAYSLLAGRPPYEVGDCSFDEALRRVRHEEPPRLGLHARELRGPIEVVVARALEKEREQRYPTAQAFMDDLQALSEGRPGAARAPSALQLAQRFARRNPRAFRIAAAFAALLLLALAGTTWGWMESRTRQREVAALLDQQREATLAADAARADAVHSRAEAERFLTEAQRAYRDANSVVAFLEDMFNSSLPGGQGPQVLLVDALKLVAPRADEYAAENPALAARLHRTLGMAFQSVASFDLALKHFDAAEALDGAQGGSDPTLPARARMARAILHVEQVEFEEAGRLLEEALALLPADERELRANATRALGRALEQGGQIAAAAERLAALLNESGHVPGVPLEVDESIRIDLAHLHAMQGDAASAEATLRAVQQARNERLGPDHAYTLEASIDLAHVLTVTGPAAEAEALYARCARGMTALLGAEHPHTLQVRASLVQFLVQTGRHAEALPELEELVAASRRALGADHPHTSGLLNLLSVAAMSTDRPDAAALADEALASARRVLGDDDPAIMSQLSNAAYVRMNDGRLEEAVVLLREALALCQRPGGADPGNQLIVENNLAGALLGLERYAELRPLLVDTLARSRTVLGDRDPQTLKLIQYLAAVCAEAREWPQARALYEEVLAANLPATETLPIHCRGELGLVLIELGESAEAEALLRATLAEAEQRLGPEHDLTVRCREGLAKLSPRPQAP